MISGVENTGRMSLLVAVLCCSLTHVTVWDIQMLLALLLHAPHHGSQSVLHVLEGISAMLSLQFCTYASPNPAVIVSQYEIM